MPDLGVRETNTGGTVKSQKLSALEQANLVRFGRSALKLGLRRGDLTLTDAFNNPYVGRMFVVDLLMELPGIGEFKATRAMHAVSVSPYARVERLTERQKLGLAEWVV